MYTSKSEAREKIQKLIEKFERIKKNRFEFSRYDEANTRKDFIMPFFKALGWDVYNEYTDHEVVEEETAVKGKVDYSFRINNIPQFLLEAKALKVSLDKIEWAKQAVTYGWNKGISWVILTDFEGLKLFNSEWLLETPHPNLQFTYGEFIARFDDLWLFSRESIERGDLNKQAEKWGIKIKRAKVTEKLANDLLRWRELLRKYFNEYNKKFNDSDIEESVQRVLDRLIFIRVCEDRQLEPPILWPALQKWIVNKRKPDNFMQALKPIFKDFDEKYNSNLFDEHTCDRLDTEGTPFEQIINDLYADKESGVKYNFAAINADVLGAIYEHYLGSVQIKGKGVTDSSKRKKQGIYYTPLYIVDYIIQNTLGLALKEKSLREIENLKVLDPACGSGSFLIRAFDLLNNKLAKEKAQEKSGSIAAFRKYNILRNNIYGVDLDSQAIEITRLNLLLKALETNHKLPLLSENTKVGNSLISGVEKELKKHFGEDWKEKRPFEWEKEFQEVLKQGGFDVIIGNPPWGANIDQEATWLAKQYPNSAKSHKDTYKIFIDKALLLLKKSGYLGFIVPSTFLYQPRDKDIKKLIDQYEHFVINLGEKIFKGVELPCCILIIKKTSVTTKPIIIDLTSLDRNILINKLQSLDLKNEKQKDVAKTRLIKDTDITFNDIFWLKDAGIQYHRFGIGLSNKGGSDLYERIFCKTKENKFKNSVKTWYGKLIGRYWMSGETDECFNLDYRNVLSKNEAVSFTKEAFDKSGKILWRQTASGILGILDDRKRWFRNTIQCAWIRDEYLNKVNILYSLAIFNSKYIDFIYKKMVLESGRVFPQVKIHYLRQLPFVLVNKKQQLILASKAEQMIKLNKELQPTPEKTDKWAQLKDKISRLDYEIDEEVYKLYNLTPEEIRIVEENFK